MSRRSHACSSERAARRTSRSAAVAFPSSQFGLAIVTGSAWCTSRYSATSSASVSVAALPRDRATRAPSLAPAAPRLPIASAPKHRQRPTGEQTSGPRVSGAKPGSAAPIGPIARKPQ
jgi:hypothetical protein